jgi:hypothetical protein
MRSLISGIVGLGLGGLILIGSLVRGGPRGEGAFLAGQLLGLLMGLLFLAAGVFYLVKGIREMNQPPPVKRRRTRRPREEDEE